MCHFISSNYKIFLFIVMLPKYANCRWEGGAPQKAQISASGALQVCSHVQNTNHPPPYREILDPRLADSNLLANANDDMSVVALNDIQILFPNYFITFTTFVMRACFLLCVMHAT
jgi:hypothetical protein